MAFKSFDQYMSDKNKDFFLLPNDKDYADVIFLYRSTRDVLVADAHYIKSADYSGYVHCCGRDCPACAKGIRVQTKIFIPLYNYKTNKIEFWDRSNHFERQLQADVLSKYPNPSEWVFRITRNGVAGDVNTTYSIVAQGKNSRNPYEKILADHGVTLPEGYEGAIRDLTSAELSQLLNSNAAAPTSEYNYIPTPRASANDYQPISASIPEPVSVTPPAFGNAPEAAAIPVPPSVVDAVEFVPEIAESEGVPFVEDAVPVSGQDTSTDDLGDVNF